MSKTSSANINYLHLPVLGSVLRASMIVRLIWPTSTCSVLIQQAVVYRKELEDIIKDNGGEYRGNLTHDVTHLVAKEPSGAKYSYAGLWGIRIVAVEWLEQSYERGMILDESLYQLSMPAEERGRNAWIRRSSSTASLGKRTRGDEVAPQNARKLRRTASARLSSQNVGLWSELVGGPVKLEESKDDAWDEQPEEALDEEASPKTSKLEDMSIAPTAGGVQQALKKSDSEVNLGSFLGRFSKETLFQGRMFLLHGFNEKQVCNTDLRSCPTTNRHCLRLQYFKDTLFLTAQK